MAYGNFTGYEPGSIPGSYNFSRADGSTIPFMGPAAEDLKSRIDRYNALQPQPTAQNEPNMSSAPDPIMSVAPPVMEEENRSVADFSAPNPSVQVPARESRGASGSWDDGQDGPTVTPQAPMPDHQLRFGTGKPGEVAYKNADGQWIAESKGTRGRKGTPMYSKEYMDKVAELETRQAADLAELNRVAQENADREAAEYQARKERAEQQVLQDAEQERTIRSRVETLSAEQERLAKDYSTSKVDPKRAFGLAQAISIILMDFGALFARQPSRSVQVISGIIDNDIRAQEAEIAVKGKAADNSLARLRTELGSLDTAKSVYRQSLFQQSAAQAEAMSASAKSNEAKARGQAIYTDLERAQLEEKEKRRQQNEAHVRATTVAGSPGGRRYLTPEQVTSIQKARGEDKKAEGATPADPNALSMNAQLDVMGERLAEKDPNKVVFAPEQQNIVTRSLRGATNLALGQGTWLPGSEEERIEQNEFDQYRNDIIAMNSVANKQGAQSGDEAERNIGAIGEARTWGDLQRVHTRLKARIEAASKLPNKVRQ